MSPEQDPEAEEPAAVPGGAAEVGRGAEHEPEGGIGADGILARSMPQFELGHTASFTSRLPRDTRRTARTEPVEGSAGARDWSRDRSVDLPEPLRRPLARRVVARRIDRAVTDALKSLDQFGSSSSS